MRIFSFSLFVPFLLALQLNAGWGTDFEKARQQAKTEHKQILLNFSGSDWCGPCIMMHKQIFESDVFRQYAEEKLVLVNADFPRSKKHQLSKEQQAQNDALAGKYNTEGIFPLTLLIDENGKVLKTWEGLPDLSAAEFTAAIKASLHAAN